MEGMAQGSLRKGKEWTSKTGQFRRNNVRYRNYLSLCEGVSPNKNIGLLTRFNEKQITGYTDY